MIDLYRKLGEHLKKFIEEEEHRARDSEWNQGYIDGMKALYLAYITYESDEETEH